MGIRRKDSRSVPLLQADRTNPDPLSSTLIDHAFDEGRDLGGKGFYSACYAPSTSMYFDQFGKVRACCQNTGGLLGDVTRHSIREIWESSSAGRLRGALADRDFSVGCGFCAWQADEVGVSEFARGFDDLNPVSIAPRWPLRMEFSMTNSCNLQCVMCNGDWSSSIRAHRERRSPLPEVYDDRFFDELQEFLPHLAEARFLGGEPFLGKEPLRVLDMLTRLEHPPKVSITTNGTQWSPRIEAICERLPISFVVSLDGMTKETYESIRIGADFDVVMENLARFGGYARRHGTSLNLAHCLMRTNYQEFAELLRFSAASGVDHVGVNTVLFPTYLSLYQLGRAELAVVLDDLERQEHGAGELFGPFSDVWDQQVSALRSRFDQLRGEQRHQFIDPWGGLVFPPLSTRTAPAQDHGDQPVRGHGQFTVRYTDGAELMPTGEVIRPIVEVGESFEDITGRPADAMVGKPLSALRECLVERFGRPVDEPATEPGVGITMTLEGEDGTVVRAEAVFVDEGATVNVIVDLHRG